MLIHALGKYTGSWQLKHCFGNYTVALRTTLLLRELRYSFEVDTVTFETALFPCKPLPPKITSHFPPLPSSYLPRHNYH